MVNPKCCIFCRNLFIGYSLFRREKPFADDDIQVNFGDILPETSKSSAFLDMGVTFNLKRLPPFSCDEAGESDGTSPGFEWVLNCQTAAWSKSHERHTFLGWSTPFWAKKWGGQLQTNNKTGAVAYKL